MAPTPEVDADGPTQPDGSTDTEREPAQLQPLARFDRNSPKLPHHRELGEHLTELFEHGVLVAREARGKVTVPQDTHALVRALVATGEQLEPYEAVFKALRKRVDEELAAELETAVGTDRNGVPNADMELQDEDGSKVTLGRSFSNVHVIDRRQAVAANVALVAHDWRTHGVDVDGQAQQFAAACVEAVIETLLPSSAEKVGIRGLEALTAMLSERGDDDLASVAETAYRRTVAEYKGVKPKRTQPPRTSNRIRRKRVTTNGKADTST